MGSIHRSLLVAASLLFATAAHAQQAQDAAPVFSLPPSNPAPASDPTRQGPELDVFREPATPRAAPTVVTPTINPPPPVVAQPAPQTQPPAARPQRPPSATPAEDRPAAPPPAAQPQPENASTPDEAPALQPTPPPATNAVEPAQSSPTPVPVTQDEGGSALPWIVGIVLAVAALAAGFLFIRRRKAALPTEPAVAAEPQPAPPQPRPAPAAKPAPPPSPPTPAPVPATDRPWLDMDLAVTQARFSLLGVTVSYSLLLHNRGERPAREVMVRGLLGNGGAQQQALLEGFFAGQDGLPLHSVVAIAPGETQSLSGELRLSPEQIVPVEMGQRSLLIPIAAFDAAYLWGEQDAEPAGHGRTARAFVVGQEQEPPADRLAPLRLDQGPRQYRRPAARAAAELTPA
ncbi:hypothetical protein [Sphingobium olei]|uniref:LPXTG cell wall anchor domain-containing protein n=1 Tax=Sphingobium olei TaxID=420955 RepID=A0ABW3P777_9SPHN